MKNNAVFFLTVAVGGAAGFALRLIQNRTGFEPDTGLPIPGNTAAIALVFLLAAAAALLAVLAFRLPENTAQPAAFPADFMTADVAALMLPVAGVFLMGISGALDILLGTGILASTAIDLPGIGTLFLFVGDTFSPTIHLLVGASSLVAAAATMLAVLACRRKETPGRAFEAAHLVIPVVALVVRLVLTYRVDSMNPSLTVYYVELLAAVLLTLGFFRLSSFAFGSGRVRPFALYSGTAVVLTLTLMADLNTLLTSTLLYLGGAAVLMGCLMLLLGKETA